MALKTGQEPPVERALWLVEATITKAVGSLLALAVKEKWPEDRR
jgi:hypothetical protein